MKPLEVRKRMVVYIRDISFLSVDGIIKKNEEKIKDLSKVLSSKLNTLDEVDEYLDYIIDYIDSTNQYFKREGKGKIPYSLLFTFASYDDKFSEFIFNKNVEEMKRKDPGLAGVATSKDNNESNNLKDFSISFKGNSYDFIYTEGGRFFFFSTETKRIVAQLFGGKILSLKQFKRLCKNEKIPRVTLATMYNKVREVEDKSETMKSFEVYFRQMRAKIDRRKRKKRTSSR